MMMRFDDDNISDDDNDVPFHDDQYHDQAGAVPPFLQCALRCLWVGLLQRVWSWRVQGDYDDHDDDDDDDNDEDEEDDDWCWNLVIFGTW